MFFASSSLKKTPVKVMLQQCVYRSHKQLFKCQSVSIKYEADCFIKRCFVSQSRVLAD